MRKRLSGLPARFNCYAYCYRDVSFAVFIGLITLVSRRSLPIKTSPGRKGLINVFKVGDDFSDADDLFGRGYSGCTFIFVH